MVASHQNHGGLSASYGVVIGLQVAMTWQRERGGGGDWREEKEIFM